MDATTRSIVIDAWRCQTLEEEDTRLSSRRANRIRDQYAQLFRAR